MLLAFADLTKIYANHQGLGAVLLQEHQRKLRTVVYASHSFTRIRMQYGELQVYEADVLATEAGNI